jgi:hypothetical protein
MKIVSFITHAAPQEQPPVIRTDCATKLLALLLLWMLPATLQAQFTYDQ